MVEKDNVMISVRLVSFVEEQSEVTEGDKRGALPHGNG